MRTPIPICNGCHTELDLSRPFIVFRRTGLIGYKKIIHVPADPPVKFDDPEILGVAGSDGCYLSWITQYTIQRIKVHARN